MTSTTLKLERPGSLIAEKAAQGGFNWNGANNGLRVPNWMHRGFQKWHRSYDKYLKDALKELNSAHPDMPPEEAAKELQILVDAEKQRLQQCILNHVMPEVISP
jgi:hypothetical protein